jgi:hypothetical protein
MAKANVAAQLENFDHRLTRVEQILPTLATKDDLLATKEELQRAIEPLATKEELRRAIEPLATKEELLATKEELRREIREEGERSRRHMDIQIEGVATNVQLLAEYVQFLAGKIPDK